MGACCSGRMVRISSLFFRIGRSFSVSFLSAVSAVVSCNKLPWLVNFFLLLLLWYGIPPSFRFVLQKVVYWIFLPVLSVFLFYFSFYSYLVPVSG